jgi:hypothetical protein
VFDSQKCTRDHHRVFINRREGRGLEGEASENSISDVLTAAPDYKTYLFVSVRIERTNDLSRVEGSQGAQTVQRFEFKMSIIETEGLV